MKTITILGSTGSVGLNALSVIRQYPAQFTVAGLAAGSRTDLLKEQIEEFKPKAVYVNDTRGCQELSKLYRGRVKVFSKSEGLPLFSKEIGSDVLVAATSGTSALLSVLGALDEGKRVALANKEILVMAGRIVMDHLRKNSKASLIPVDSEHSAIFQCLHGNPTENVRKVILTGTGGPLREVSRKEFSKISKEKVIRHPKWKMGKKISVDSATLMNKGLEIIEALWLFDLSLDKIDILIHPEAVIHSMVEFHDGAVLAQLGVTDMKLPIQYALCFPDRFATSASMRLDFSEVSKLTFCKPDRKKFPCLEIAYQAAVRLGSAPWVLSGADEAAVGAFLEDRIHFMEIPKVIEKVLSRHRHVSDPGLSEIQSIHRWAVEETERLCQAL